MAEIRRDQSTHRWVIISTDNPMDPEDFEPGQKKTRIDSCPFCPGNESMTPGDIFSIPSKTGGWQLRVFPNKFPALRIEGELNKTGTGIYDMMNGIGAHEVIVETPDHAKDLVDLLPDEMDLVIRAYRDRIRDLRRDSRFRYILVFKNEGAPAGASVSHSHSQLIALPIIPKRVSEEIWYADAHFEQTRRCIFCDTIQQELREKTRVVLETPQILVYAPYASRFPFELWVLPKEHLAHFADSPEPLLLEAGDALRKTLEKLRTLLRHPSYNFLIHTSPLAAPTPAGYHWHIELMPRLTHVAGFEWGSGFYINPTPPESAARFLREVKPSLSGG
ncbi:MAG: galactose-1-phosphate uridylyltransferase [Candidatus Omnitrophica bacterium]|nr:galactose-1-phosphate uridylyltransferase [Candidatus Omnitrophota bacterium]